MSNYLNSAIENHASDNFKSKQITPATQPIPGTNMQPNRDGGYSFVMDDWGVLARFLMIGALGSGYNANAKFNAKTGMDIVKKCAEADHQRVIDMIVEISTGGRAPKNDPAVVALAQVAAIVGKPAFDVLPKVCRIGTHLFQFISIYNVIGKWNAAAKRGVSAWYTNRQDDRLATQLLKYQQREGWSHGDVLRLAHVKPQSESQSAMFGYAARGDKKAGLPGLYDVVFKLNAGDLSVKQVVALIEQTPELVWEMIPTQYLAHADVMVALIPNMGITALTRKLGSLTAKGIMDSSDMRTLIANRLTDKDAIKNGRLHPITILQAYKQYELGHGDKGSLTWNPDAKVKSALDDAFYLAFDYLPDTGETYYVGADISGSMSSYFVNGSTTLRASDVAVVMAMATVRTQKNAHLFGFNRNLVDLGIRADMSLQAATAKYRNLHWDMSSTNAGKLFEHAIANKVDVDKFIVITDNDINEGSQPMSLLRKHRQKTGKGKMAVIATSMSEFTICDPKDSGCIDIAGFDSAAPSIIANM